MLPSFILMVVDADNEPKLTITVTSPNKDEFGDLFKTIPSGTEVSVASELAVVVVGARTLIAALAPKGWSTLTPSDRVMVTCTKACWYAEARPRRLMLARVIAFEPSNRGLGQVLTVREVANTALMEAEAEIPLNDAVKTRETGTADQAEVCTNTPLADVYE